MRIAVTGIKGQVARALVERGAPAGLDVVALGRPGLDLAEPGTIAPALTATAPDIVVNAAAFTGVDKAEGEEALARAVNGRAAGVVAEVAARLQVPVVHISTDYVFSGDLDRPYREDDALGPLGAYGRSKAAGEAAVAQATSNHAILRTAWVYSPFGSNFVKTMLRLATTRDQVDVVSDQHGSPTSALDMADGILEVCRNLLQQPENPGLRGIFHMAGAGYTTWAGFAETIFIDSRARGGPSAVVRQIPTSGYPTPAKRPANSRLDCAKLLNVHGVSLPEWRTSTATCVARLVDESKQEHGL